MGLILDSSILIASERRGRTAREAMKEIAFHIPGQEVAISVITLSELMHGVVRADSSARRESRKRFIDEVVAAIPVLPVTASIALRTGHLDGEHEAKGIKIGLADLLIGVTALELGFGVATGNARHFRLIPGLRFVQF